MNRRFRLTRSTDYKRVRRFGKSYAHPLVVLVVHPDEQPNLRFAVSAGRSVGGAVQRNRAKRLLREVLRPLLPSITHGCEAVWIARAPMSAASIGDVRQAVITLLRRAKLLPPLDGNRNPPTPRSTP